MNLRNRYSFTKNITLSESNGLCGKCGSLTIHLFGDLLYSIQSNLQKTTDVTANIIDSLGHSGQIQIILDGKQAVGLDKIMLKSG